VIAKPFDCSERISGTGRYSPGGGANVFTALGGGPILPPSLTSPTATASQ
jgi:hypothetical protein